MVGMAFGTITHRQSLDSLAGFAETVMPALAKEAAPAK
jgi:hypothetical protein